MSIPDDQGQHRPQAQTNIATHEHLSQLSTSVGGAGAGEKTKRHSRPQHTRRARIVGGVSKLNIGRMSGASAASDKLHGPAFDQNMPTFAAFIEERYMPHALATKRSACWEQIIFRNHLLPEFADLRLDQITRSAISLMVQKKIVAGYKPGTVNRILANLKTVLAKAVEWEIGGLDKNVARQVKALRDPPHLDRFLSQGEAERLIDAVRKSNSPMLRYIIPFLLFTGARKREVLDARWMYVKLDQGMWTIPITKSGKPRHIPLSDQAVAVLIAAKTMMQSVMQKPSEWVFPNPMTGKPYTSIFQPWDICRRSVGLADVRIHDLRHSFASALVNRGMTLYDVKEVLGHSNIATTQRYAHLSSERLREAVKQAGDHYGGAASFGATASRP